MATTERFGLNLRRLRMAAGMSQARLADAVGMDVTAISRIERGTRNPTLTTIDRLALALRVDPGQLVSESSTSFGPSRRPPALEPSVVIARLIVNATAERKLAARSIDLTEARELIVNGPYMTRNPHPRVASSRLLIGATNGGRILTLVVQPDAADDSAWHVMTGWPSTRREIAARRAAS